MATFEGSRAGESSAAVSRRRARSRSRRRVWPGSLRRQTFFTADSRFVVFQILPTKAETEKAKKEKKRPEEMPKNAMGIMDLSTGEVTRVDRVKSFQVPEEGAGFIAYSLEAKVEERRPEDRRPDAAAACASQGPPRPRDEGVRHRSGAAQPDRQERTHVSGCARVYAQQGREESGIYGVVKERRDQRRICGRRPRPPTRRSRC